MPLKSYGVLKAKPVDTVLAPGAAHLEIHLKSKGENYRIALNVRSQAVPAELRYIIHKDFIHPFVNNLINIEEGITSKSDNPSIALDYIRSNLFNYRKMKIAPEISEGDNELSDMIQLYVERAIKDETAMIYAFGEYWGPEEKEDMYFKFKPGQGIHDIHMNQGNAGRWARDNGAYQDGGMLIHFPSENHWAAFFTAFQSQSFHTDESGNVLPVELDDENAVYIISALLNPKKGSRNVTLLNRTPRTISIDNWKLTGQKGRPLFLNGGIRPGEFLTVELRGDALYLPKEGGTISLIDNSGLKIHGVSYTTPDYAKKGYRKVF